MIIKRAESDIMNDVKIKDIKDSDELIRFALNVVSRHAVALTAGFFSACASFEGLSPFGAAYASCIFPEYIPAAVTGVAMGYFHIYGASVLTLRYIASAMVAAILSYIFKRNIKRKFHGNFGVITSFFSLFSTGIIMSLSVTLSSDEFVLYGIEGLAGAVSSWFADKFLQIKPSKRCVSRLSGTETACVLIVFGLMLLSLKNFNLFVILPSVTAGVYFVLVAATFGGDKYGSLTGIVAGVVLGTGSENSFLTGGIALGGLLSGIFGKRNRFVSSLIFFIILAVTAFSAEDWLSASYVMYSAGISVAVFLFMPKKVVDVFRNFFAYPDDDGFLSDQRRVLKLRLKTAADSMSDVTSSVKAVAGIYHRRNTPKKENICLNVCNSVCRNCPEQNFCMKNNYKETAAGFMKIADTIMHGKDFSEKELPQKFLDTCIIPDKIIKNIFYETEKYRNAVRESAKSGETVNLVADQFGSVSELLDSFCETMETDEEYDVKKTGMVCDVLVNDLGINLLSCGVFRNADNKLFCEMSFSKCNKFSKEQIEEAVSEVLGVHMENSVVYTLSGGIISVAVCEKTKYSVETGGYQISSDGGKWCGDTFCCFADGRGKIYVILSDGMGTGQKAAADSVMCCSLASSLLRAGYPMNSVIKMINSAMIVRSGEESLATLDIAVLNLYNGNVEFYKAGAAASIAMKHNKLLKIEKPSLPVGILGSVKFEKIELNLRDGDSFVLMSDGVSDNAVSAWREILKDATDYEGRELAEKLAKTAHMNSDDSTDDITVVTAAIRINE